MRILNPWQVIVLLCCTINLTAYSQRNSFELSTGNSEKNFKGLTSSWMTYANVNDNNATAAISFADHDNVYYYLVDSSFKMLNQYTVSKDELGINYFNEKYEVILQTSQGNLFKKLYPKGKQK